MPQQRMRFHNQPEIIRTELVMVSEQTRVDYYCSGVEVYQRRLARYIKNIKAVFGYIQVHVV